MKGKLDTFLTAVLVACAVVSVAILIRREFAVAPVVGTEQSPVFIADWRSHLSQGVLMGSSAAPVQIVEFGDFECPYCASFSATLKLLRERYPDDVAVTFVQYPLEFHRFAELAARAAECAGTQGHFDEMHDVLFAQQRAFGLKPWSDMAREAGVMDLDGFATCMNSAQPVAHISEGKALGETLDVQGTPTIVVNGWKLPRPPSEGDLDRMIRAILAGESPIQGAAVRSQTPKT